MNESEYDVALESFKAAAEQWKRELQRAHKVARSWAWFWFTCWAISVVSRTWEAVAR